MTLKADLYWSFRSPYSYLILPRIEALVSEWDLDIDMRFVYPIAVRALISSSGSTRFGRATS